MSKFRNIFRPLITKVHRYFQNCCTLRFRHYLRPIPQSSIPLISWFFLLNQVPTLQFDVEQQISQMISKAENFLLDDKLSDASLILNNALNLADKYQAYENLSYLCDMLIFIAVSKGEFLKTEHLLEDFTVKLSRLGYPESHNSVLQFKLTLARLYQLIGIHVLAEYQLRDSIRVIEKQTETNQKLDEKLNEIYLTALFLYGNLLTDQKEFHRAKTMYKKYLRRISKSASVLPLRKIVVLHNIARISAILKDLDGALNYIHEAIEICLLEDPSNQNLPKYVVFVGFLYMEKGFYDVALLWCETGLSLASHEGNQLAELEANKCIQQLQKYKTGR